MKKEVKIALCCFLSVGLQAQTKKLSEKDSIKAIKEIAINGTLNKFASKNVSNSLRLKTELAKLPQNIQIVTAELLRSQNVTTMMDNVSRNVSGAQMNEHFGNYANIYMRGFKLPAFRNGMNIDIGYGPLATDLAMVETIEFVKGPAGFMNAVGSSSGIYNVVTKKPSKKNVTEINLTSGSYNFYRGALDAGGTLTPDGKLQFRLNAMYQNQETHRAFEKNSRYSIVPSLKYEFSKGTSITTEFTIQKAKQMLSAAYVFAPLEKGLGSVSREMSHIEKNYPQSNLEEVTFYTEFNHHFSKTSSINAQYMIMQYKQLGYTNWITSIDKLGNTTRYLNNFDTKALTEIAQVYSNQEVQLLGMTHKTIIGIDYKKLKSTYDWSQTLPYDITPFNTITPIYGQIKYPIIDRTKGLEETGNGTQYVSLYAQDEIWTFKNKLRLTLGGRYFNGKSNDDYKEKVTIKEFTPRIGASIDLAQNMTMYAQYDNTINPNYGVNKQNEGFDPEKTRSIEAGLKKSFLNDKLKTTTSLYKIRKERVLVTDPTDINYKIQVGSIESKGVEFDLQGQLTPELNMVINYAFTEAKIKEDTNPLNIGKRVEGFSKHTTNGWLNYNFKDQSVLKGFGVTLGYQYLVDRSTSNWAENNRSLLPDYFRLDGGISWKRKGLNLALNANNLLNSYLYSGGYVNYGAGAIAYWQSEPGTNWKATINYKF